MLVLTRKIDEQIVIGDNIKITVIKVRNNQVRIGISAPRDVRVLRGELEPKEAEATQSDDTQMVVDLELDDESTQALLKTTEEIETSYRPPRRSQLNRLPRSLTALNLRLSNERLRPHPQRLMHQPTVWGTCCHRETHPTA